MDRYDEYRLLTNDSVFCGELARQTLCKLLVGFAENLESLPATVLSSSCASNSLSPAA
jgi:hypothetical protein